MANNGKGWDEQLRDASSKLEEEIRRAVRYLDDEVVPEIRRNSSVALRTASEQLRKLAEKLEDESRKRESSGS